MPRVFFRLLAVALLALAIPVQGMASVVAGQCMAFGHHQDGGSHDHAHADGGADGHDLSSHSHSDHSAAQGDDEEKNSHCGPCTACCASASIAGPAALSILASPFHAKYAFSQLPSPGIQPHRLDRPPLAL